MFQAGQVRSIYPACHKVPVSRFPGCMQDLHQDWLHQPFITSAGYWRLRLCNSSQPLKLAVWLQGKVVMWVLSLCTKIYQLISSVVHSYCAENLNELKKIHIVFIYFHSCICWCLSEKEQLMQVSCEQVDRRQVEPAVLYSNFLSILVALLCCGWAVRPESQRPGSHRCTKCTTTGLHRPRHPSLYWQ